MGSNKDNKFSMRAKLQLVRRRLTVVALAAELGGKPRQTVSSVINGSTRFPNLRKQVAQYLRIRA